jgi:GTP cyclohydrolase I
MDIERAQGAIKELIEAFGVDLVAHDHLDDTPRRVASAWAQVLSGYTLDPREHLATTFTAPRDPGLVIVSGIVVQSTCAHHLLPFTGSATVAYRPSPSQRIVGLSKLARVVDGYARRLQVQEALGMSVLDALLDVLNPSGAAVLITARHECMSLRGACEPDAMTTTMANAGLLTPDEMALIRASHVGAGSGLR